MGKSRENFITPLGEIENLITTRYARDKYIYLDDYSIVPPDVSITDPGPHQKKYANDNLGNKREIVRMNSFYLARLIFVDDHKPVPEDATILEEGKGKSKRKYVVTYDEEGNVANKRQVKTRNALSKSRLFYVDDNTKVGKDTVILEERSGIYDKKYAVTYDEQGNINSKREVQSASTKSKKRLFYIDDKTAVPEDSIIIEEKYQKYKKRKYVITYDIEGNINSKREIKSSAALNQKQLKFLDDGSLVSKDAIIIEEGKGNRKRRYVVTYDEQGTINSKREVKDSYSVNRALRETMKANLPSNLSQTSNSNVNLINHAATPANAHILANKTPIDLPPWLINQLNKDLSTEEEVLSFPQWVLNDLCYCRPEQEVQTDSTNEASTLETQSYPAFALRTPNSSAWPYLFQSTFPKTDATSEYQPRKPNSAPYEP